MLSQRRVARSQDRATDAGDEGQTPPAPLQVPKETKRNETKETKHKKSHFTGNTKSERITHTHTRTHTRKLAKKVDKRSK